MKVLKVILMSVIIVGAYIASIFMGSKAAMYYYLQTKRKVYEFLDENV